LESISEDENTFQPLVHHSAQLKVDTLKGAMFNTYMVDKMAEPVKPPVFFGRCWSLRRPNKNKQVPQLPELYAEKFETGASIHLQSGSDPGF